MVVEYERRGAVAVAVVTMNRPEFRNAQNSAMTYALDEAFYRAAEDDEVKVVVLAGAGPHFSAGHDIGTPGRDAGATYFAHPWVMPPRVAKEFLYTGDRMPASRAYELGWVNRVVARDALEEETLALAARIAAMPRMGLALTKKAVNQAEDLQGLHAGMDAVFGLHHLAHAHNAETGGDSLGGQDARSMKAAQQ